MSDQRPRFPFIADPAGTLVIRRKPYTYDCGDRVTALVVEPDYDRLFEKLGRSGAYRVEGDRSGIPSKPSAIDAVSRPAKRKWSERSTARSSLQHPVHWSSYTPASIRSDYRSTHPHGRRFSNVANLMPRYDDLPFERVKARTDEWMTPVLYLDIDGTVREGKDDPLGKFVNGPEDVRVFPQAVAQMYRWKGKHARIIGISNQGGVALGHLPFHQMINAMVETQNQCDGLFDKIATCVHHPDAADPEMARCWCRKPMPGLIIESALDLADRHLDEIYPPHLALYVGDRDEDREAAARVGLDFILASDWRREVE